MEGRACREAAPAAFLRRHKLSVAAHGHAPHKCYDRLAPRPLLQELMALIEGLLASWLADAPEGSKVHLFVAVHISELLLPILRSPVAAPAVKLQAAKALRWRCPCCLGGGLAAALISELLLL